MRVVGLSSCRMPPLYVADVADVVVRRLASYAVSPPAGLANSTINLTAHSKKRYGLDTSSPVAFSFLAEAPPPLGALPLGGNSGFLALSSSAVFGRLAGAAGRGELPPAVEGMEKDEWEREGDGLGPREGEGLMER